MLSLSTIVRVAARNVVSGSTARCVRPSSSGLGLPSSSCAFGRQHSIPRRVVHSGVALKSYVSGSEGPQDSFDFRVFNYTAEGKTLVSAWHDVPLYAGEGTMNFLCEIPKETSAKMELATDEVRNPIKQDIKKGKLRHYPYNIHWNYGMLPQTWEDPGHTNAELKAAGDNDPVDVVEIGSAVCEMGGIYQVKPLGVYAMLDDGELDWKVIAIRTDDPKAGAVHDVDDVEREFPGELQRIMEWFRDYKIPDGKPANAFGYGSKALDKAFTMQVVDECHGFYTKLKSGARANTEGLSLV